MWTHDRGSGRKWAHERGVASVEFAIVAPLLLLLMLAVAELGWAFHQYNVLTKAVRDGVRYAAANAMPGSTGVVVVSPDLIVRTSNVVVYGNELGMGARPVLDGLATDAVSVTAVGSEYVQVQVDWPYTPLLGPLLPTFGLGAGPLAIDFDFSASSVLRGL